MRPFAVQYASPRKGHGKTGPLAPFMLYSGKTARRRHSKFWEDRAQATFEPCLGVPRMAGQKSLIPAEQLEQCGVSRRCRGVCALGLGVRHAGTNRSTSCFSLSAHRGRKGRVLSTASPALSPKGRLDPPQRLGAAKPEFQVPLLAFLRAWSGQRHVLATLCSMLVLSPMTRTRRLRPGGNNAIE